jgi:hypothetical protein
MDYTNPHQVRFKIFPNGLVKYYPKVTGWPRTYQTFQCADDDMRREMFYILSTLRLCSICRNCLHDESRSTCQNCVLREILTSGIQEDQIAECPVCYNKMFRVNGSRKSLVCRHEMCATCMRRMIRPYPHAHLDPIYGARPTCTITCPLCRNKGWYDYNLNIILNGIPPI